MKDNSLGFDKGIDAGCFVYAYTPKVQSPSFVIPLFCDLGGSYMGDDAVYPLYTGKLSGGCWGYGCEGNMVLAKYNSLHGFHLTYKTVFSYQKSFLVSK